MKTVKFSKVLDLRKSRATVHSQSSSVRCQPSSVETVCSSSSSCHHPSPYFAFSPPLGGVQRRGWDAGQPKTIWTVTCHHPLSPPQWEGAQSTSLAVWRWRWRHGSLSFHGWMAMQMYPLHGRGVTAATANTTAATAYAAAAQAAAIHW